MKTCYICYRALTGDTTDISPLSFFSKQAHNVYYSDAINCAQQGCAMQYKIIALTISFSFNRPYVRSKGRKFERARGRRKSRGYKV